MSRRILAVVGMQAEARLLARVGIASLLGGGDPARLAAELDRLLSPCEAGGVPPKGGGGATAPPPSADLDTSTLAPTGRSLRSRPPPPLRRGGEFTAVLSFGVGGGLDPLLKAGDLVIASEIRRADGARGADRASGLPGKRSADSADRALPADPAWVERLQTALPAARSGSILGQDNPAVSAGEKFLIFSASGALAVDMESHVAAEAAARHGLPFAAIRAVSDPAGRTLPPAAVAGFGADGQADVGAVLRALARDPRQLPALVRTGIEAGRAFGALRRAAAALSQADVLPG